MPERALTTWLLLDVSPSMAFGTADRRKADVAEGVAIAFGHLATQRGNRLGVLTFGGRPTGGSRPIGRPCRPARDARRRRRSTADGTEVGFKSPGRALRFVAHGGAAPAGSSCWSRTSAARAIGCLCSAAVAARHQVLAVEIRDPREDALPDVGELTSSTPRPAARSASTRRRATCATGSPGGGRGSAPRSPLELRRLGVGHAVLSTSGSWLRSLAGQLRTLGIAS